MKKIILSLAFVFVSIVGSAQVTRIVTAVNEAGDVASFDLDCSKTFPTLAKGLKYNITRHEFKGTEMRNTYHILIVMDGFYVNSENKTMEFSAVFSDGTIVKNMKTLENDGYFDGACTLQMGNPPDKALNLELKQIIVHTDKDVVYEITEKKAKEFKTNVTNIVNAK